MSTDQQNMELQGFHPIAAFSNLSMAVLDRFDPYLLVCPLVKWIVDRLNKTVTMRIYFYDVAVKTDGSVP